MKALRFNQDATCCVVIQDQTVSIYNCDPFGKCFNIDCNDAKLSANNSPSNSTDIDDNDNNNANLDTQMNMGSDGLTARDNECVVEMLFSTSLVAMAAGSSTSRRKLKIVNTKRKSTICELVFPTDVVDVVMNRKRMCILLSSDQIFIYDISCMKPLETIDLWEDKIKLLSVHQDETYVSDVNKLLKNQLQNGNNASNSGIDTKSNNPTQRERRNSIRSRICPQIALSNDDRSVLAFTTYHTSKSNPSSHLLRDVIIYDAMNVKPINYLNNVHKGNIACLAINQEGTLITTASDKGTIIRVYNTGVNKDNNGTRDNTPSPQFYGTNPLYAEFRRGNRPCNLYQLTFNIRSTLIGCIGDSGTIHIFKLDNPDDDRKDSSSENSSLSRQDELALQANKNHSLVSSQQSNLERSKQMAHFLSKRIKASIPNQSLQRDYAHINFNDTGVRYSLGFPDEFPHQVYIAGDDGKFRTFALPKVSGECVLTSTNTFM